MEPIEDGCHFNFLTVKKTAFPLTAAVRIIYQQNHLHRAAPWLLLGGLVLQSCLLKHLLNTLHVDLGLLGRAKAMCRGRGKGGSDIEPWAGFKTPPFPILLSLFAWLELFYFFCVYFTGNQS